MKPDTSLAQTAEPPPPPNIVALEKPTESDLLREQVSTLTQEAASARAKHAAELREKERDIALVRAEMEDLARQLKTANTEREEAAAQWETWSKHPFAGALYQLEAQGAGLLAELTEHTDKVIVGIADAGKAGSVTLKLAFKQSDEQHGAIIVATKITSSVPKGDPVKAYFWMKDGQVTEDDPTQKRLPLSGDKSRKPKEQPAAPPQVVEPSATLSEDDAALCAALCESCEELCVDGILPSIAQIQAHAKVNFTKARTILKMLQSRP